MTKADLKSVGECIASRPRGARGVLRRVRRAVRRAPPGAAEVISYKIAAYKLDGRVVVYFAGWSRHCSLYPATDHVVASFADELAPYEVSKVLFASPSPNPFPRT